MTVNTTALISQIKLSRLSLWEAAVVMTDWCGEWDSRRVSDGRAQWAGSGRWLTARGTGWRRWTEPRPPPNAPPPRGGSRLQSGAHRVQGPDPDTEPARVWDETRPTTAHQLNSKLQFIHLFFIHLYKCINGNYYYFFFLFDKCIFTLKMYIFRFLFTQLHFQLFSRVKYFYLILLWYK